MADLSSHAPGGNWGMPLLTASNVCYVGLVTFSYNVVQVWCLTSRWLDASAVGGSMQQQWHSVEHFVYLGLSCAASIDPASPATWRHGLDQCSTSQPQVHRMLCAVAGSLKVHLHQPICR